MSRKTKKELILLIVIVLAISMVWLREILSKPQNVVVINAPKIANNKLGEGKYYLTEEQINCESLKEEISDEIENKNYCERDSDCLVADSFGCPFGCYNLININKETDFEGIKNRVEKYASNCVKCEYKCKQRPDSYNIKCEDKKCVDISDNL